MGPESSRRRALHRIRCSFCGKPGDQVTAIVAGPTQQIAICNECVDLCGEIIDEQTQPADDPPPAAA